jgi:putative mRNA 3-end processing factor
MASGPLLEPTEKGLYCARGDFYVDPWRPVPRAVITHAHADHATNGCERYLTATDGVAVLQARMGRDAVVAGLAPGQSIDMNGVDVSFHPAGHLLGSSQVRVESKGEIWVVSGDYKVEPDRTCAPFETVRCHTFVTESTFGLPIYRWVPQSEIFDEINAWWRANQEAGRASLLFAYSLGKAQRLLAGVNATIGPIYAHGAVEAMNLAYRETGVELPQTTYASAAVKGTDFSRAMVVAPPSAHGSPWARKFGSSSSAFASGWMQIRGPRRRKAVDRGFVLSDHADWPGLLGAISATGASRVLVTHGYTAVLVRWLREQGLDADVLATQYRGEQDDVAGEEQPADEADADVEKPA